MRLKKDIIQGTGLNVDGLVDPERMLIVGVIYDRLGISFEELLELVGPLLLEKELELLGEN
jgi:hypothetical protein